MCGRHTYDLTWQQVHDLYRNIARKPKDPRQGEFDLRPHYNVAPTQLMPVLRLDRDGQPEVVMLKWGFIPSWANDPKIGYKMIKARAETVATAPSFRAAFKRRRCLIPTTGYYEWRKLEDGTKQPYLFTMRDGQPFSFAGLWERWDKGEEPIETCTIITREPNSLAAEIHNRMPVIIEPGDYDAWLHAADTAIAQTMLQPFPSQLMRYFPVSKRVNSPKNDDRDLVTPIAA
jgi:putative SOS response-associated peptidase YedK